MRRWNITSLMIIIVAAFFSLVRPAVAGQPKPMPQLEQRPPAVPYDDQSFGTLKVTTNLVVLDVIATDRKGKPVTDLKAGDFTLLEDNHEQKISIFQLQQPALSPAGLPVGVVNTVISIQASFAAGAFDIVTGDVERLGGRPPKPLRDVLAGALKSPSA